MNLSLITIEQSSDNKILIEPAQEVVFPLSELHQSLIDAMLVKVVDIQGAGLAAPQVNFPYKIIVYQVTEIARSSCKDWGDKIIPATVLINPSYKPIIESGFTDDWEGCFSVSSQMGKIRRYTSIYYQGFNRQGQKIAGQANGYLARILQHEIDHINGQLIISKFQDDLTHGPMEEMKKIREKELNSYNS